MIEVLAGTGRLNAELGDRLAWLDGPDLRVMEHPVALLPQEGHVHGEALRGAVALVAQALLRLHVILHGEQGPRYEVPRCVNVQ